MLNTVKLAIAATVAAATGSLSLFDEPATVAPKNNAHNAPLSLAKSDDSARNPFGFALANNEQDKRVTVRINGTLDDVVKWLGDTGVSFVLENRSLASRKVTLNLVNQPIEDAIAAIAEALDVSWSKRGEVYVLGGSRPAIAPRVFAVPKVDSKIAPKAEFRIAPKADLKGLSPQDRAKIEAEIKKSIEAAQKAIEETEVRIWTPGAPTAPGMSDKERKAFEEAMAKVREELKRVPGEVRVWTDAKPMTDAERKAFEESMKKLREEMKRLPDDIRVHVAPLTDEQKKALDRVKVELKDLPKVPKVPVVLNKDNIGQLLKSMSPAQRAKHDKEGFLKLSDLTAAQKKLLGNPSGTFTISVNMDGQKLTIKNP